MFQWLKGRNRNVPSEQTKEIKIKMGGQMTGRPFIYRRSRKGSIKAAGSSATKAVSNIHFTTSVACRFHQRRINSPPSGQAREAGEISIFAAFFALEHNHIIMRLCVCTKWTWE